MKIKSIKDFTLAECQEYLDTNPNGELAQEVVQRMEYLKRRLQEDNARWINEFNTEFNLLFANKRYLEAFLLCVNSSANPLLSFCAQEKGDIVIPFLQKIGVINVPDNTSMEFIIDILINNGCGKFYLKKNASLYIFPIIRIELQNNVITVKQPLLPMVLLACLFPLICPLFMLSQIKLRKIIRLICRALLQLNINN